jgi:hypothetical protein
MTRAILQVSGVRATGFALSILAAGCAGMGNGHSAREAELGPLVVEQALLMPIEQAPEAVPVAAEPAAPAPLQLPDAAVEPIVKPIAKPIAKPVAKPVAKPIAKDTPAPAAKEAEPPLDIAALKTRLRDTDAIGVFTKLALRNEMDDLIKQFRTLHQSGQKAGAAALRQPYDSLVLKVVTVVQDGDPSLARTISGSREAIWEILSDPQKFNAAT